MKKNDLFALSLIKGVGKKSLLNVLGTGYEISELISLSEDELGSFIKGSGKANAIDIIKNQYEQLYETADQEI